MLESFKVRAACDEAGIDPRMARVINQVHGLSRGGTRPDRLALKPGETLRDALGPLHGLMDKQTALGQQVRDTARLLTDPEYRAAMYWSYQEILPRVQSMSALDIVRVLRSKARKESES